MIIPQPNVKTPNLGPAIEREYANAFLALDGGHGWLVSAVGVTSQQISEKLGISSGENGAAIAVELASYYGRANPNIWTWIKANWDAPKGG